MPKQVIPFSDFVTAAGPEHEEFINSTHNFLLENNCTVNIKEAKNGYVVSYIHTPAKKTLANYVFRKKGPMMRIYADNVPGYMEILDKWPDDMKSTIKKAGPCKRMLDPAACNSRCQMGFDFILDGERQQKCRNGGFMFFLEDTTKPHLSEMLQKKILVREA